MADLGAAAVTVETVTTIVALTMVEAATVMAVAQAVTDRKSLKLMS
jgi:hypothetical protein